MSIRRCDAGEHTYDDAKHSNCPYCRKTRLTVSPGGGKNELPPSEAPKTFKNRTTPAPGINSTASSDSKTRIVFGGGSGETIDFGDITPVVGWLVVVGGNGQGQDLRITPGMNHIGRDRGDIVINFGESSISREKHASIAYDPDENIFMIAHGEGKNLTKKNGKMIMGSEELNVYDRISIGSTELMFVPLCGNNFSWDETVEEKS